MARRFIPRKHSITRSENLQNKRDRNDGLRAQITQLKADLAQARKQGWNEAIEEVAQHADTDELAAEIRRLRIEEGE